MKYFLYILRSRKDENYYVGITRDVNKRIQSHNKGRVRSTKGRIPFEVVYTEQFPNRLEARQREVYLKSYQGAKEKLTILENV